MRAFGLILASVGMLVAAPANAAAQTDVSGTWDLIVMTEQGDQPVQIVVVQDGSDLTATGDGGEIGEIEMTGMIDGSDITLEWDLYIEGTELLIVFTGTLAEDGTISGTMDLGGFGEGDWTAKRAM